MPQVSRIWNHGSPDRVSGGIQLARRVVQNRGDFDTGVYSILTQDSETTGGITPGAAMPGEPSLFCTTVEVELVEAGSYRRTGQYKGFSGRTGGVGTIDNLTETNCRISETFYTREGSWNPGDGGFSSMIIPGFPGDDTKPARFTMMAPGIRAQWIASNKVSFPITLTAAQSPPGSPPSPVWPYSDDLKRVRVFPNGWMLRNLSQERIAEGVDIWTGTAEWIYEWPWSF